MINYEVNLEIDKTIYITLLEWLPGHIQEILNLKGFKKAQIFEESLSTVHRITICYELDKLEDLQHYFDHYATSMQNKTKEMFGDKIKASRRILKLTQSYSKETM